jgi:hypothetical protein
LSFPACALTPAVSFMTKAVAMARSHFIIVPSRCDAIVESPELQSERKRRSSGAL